jgi:hypothetical protein
MGYAGMQWACRGFKGVQGKYGTVASLRCACRRVRQVDVGLEGALLELLGRLHLSLVAEERLAPRGPPLAPPRDVLLGTPPPARRLARVRRGHEVGLERAVPQLLLLPLRIGGRPRVVISRVAPACACRCPVQLLDPLPPCQRCRGGEPR